MNRKSGLYVGVRMLITKQNHLKVVCTSAEFLNPWFFISFYRNLNASMVTSIKLSTYGILIRDQKLLISSEVYQGNHLVKFPGGSVEYGEGLRDALIREWYEELQVQIEVGSLIYLTEDFVQSAFTKGRQIVSFYYQVFTDAPIIGRKTEHEVRWLPLDQSVEKTNFTFPLDRKIFKILQERFLMNPGSEPIV